STDCWSLLVDCTRWLSRQDQAAEFTPLPETLTGNLLYYLSPDTEQKAILNFIERRSQQKGRYVEDWDISFDFNREVIIA
ncbi:hypothetical protein, partial [Alicyclobacillus tolerans]